MPTGKEQRDLYIEEDLCSTLATLRNHGRRASGNLVCRAESPKGSPNSVESRFCVESTYDHDRQVIRRIVGIEEITAGGHRHLLDITPPANRRPTVWMGLPDQCGERLEAAAVGTIFRAQPAFLEYDFALTLERLR